MLSTPPPSRMPPSIARLALLVLLVAPLTACASGGARETDTAVPSVTPPAIVGQQFPDLSTIPSDRTSTQVDLRVMVNPDGTPDMSSVTVTGTSSAARRDAFVMWISRSRFKPGTQGGVPVRAEFRMRMKSKVEVRRVG